MNSQHSLSTTISRSWFPQAGAKPAAKIRLFCFPYAGGSSAVFHSWTFGLPDDVEVVPVHLPARGTRLLEKPFVRIGPLLENLREAIEPLLDLPFAFFGHSMGAILGFELARSLRRAGRKLPQHLFVSGRRAPQIPDDDPLSYLLPDHELVAELERLNGTPQEVLQNQEMMRLVLPLVRADLELIQSYEYCEEAALPCGISAYGGLNDREVELDDMAGWKDQTASSFRLRPFDGDHFFIVSCQSSLLNIMSNELLLILEQNSRYGTARRVAGLRNWQGL